mmetsp:Transcript_5922/g.17808  ORF Transcript_5922/g.17808 Transcript_5922/m.17808 type:complete len:393 (+) Transcript_5922:213-1391(+)
MAHLVGKAGLLNGSNRVASSNDGGHALAGEVGERISDVEGSLGKGLKLEHSHGTVPDDGLALAKLLLDHLGRVGSVVETHPAVRNLVDRNDLGVSVSGELVGDNDVGGQDELYALLLGLLLELLGKVQAVLLNERGSGAQASCLQEGENHASAEDELVDLSEERLNDANLCRHLGSSNDGSERTSWIGDGSLEIVELLLQEESSHGRLQVLGNSGSRTMGTVSTSKSIVHVHISVRSKLLGKLGVVLLLLLVESDILQEEDVAIVHLADHALDLRADAVGRHLHVLAEELAQTAGDRLERELVLRSRLWSAQVRRQDHLGASVDEVLHRRDRGTDTGVIRDLGAVERHVEITSDQHLLALEVIVGQILDRLLRHHGDRRRSDRDGCASRQAT